MVEGLALCAICNRQVLDNGQCLFCTTSEALDLPQMIPDEELTPPTEGEVMCMAELGGQNRRWDLVDSRVRIGRDPKCQICLAEDVYVSRQHSFITYEEGIYWIEDLGSKNGTLVNRAHILDREPLKRGDIVTIGHTQFRCE